MTASRSSSVLWLQVWSLALVQGSITLTWLFYGLYLPKLLVQFGLAESLAGRLLVIESVIAIVMEPLMGGLSDRAQRWVGTRLPFISVGIVASASLFIAIPAIVLLGQPTQALQLVMLTVTVLWAMAMAAFRSPVLCLLGMYAAVPSLPQAFSVLSLVGGLVGALRPWASDVILTWGPAITFAIGSFTLLGGAAALRAVHPPTTPEGTPEATPETTLANPSLVPSLLWLAFTGMGAAWGIRLLMGQVFPTVLKTLLSGGKPNLWMGIISIGIGVLAVPLGKIATRWGNQRLMLAGTVGVMAGLLLCSVSQISGLLMGAILLLTIAASILLNGVIPLTLSVVPPRWGGLGIGMYFGGFSAAIALFGAVMPKELALTQAIGQCIAAFAIAGLAIAALKETK